MRTFRVKVEEARSDLFQIDQGTVLSPILFSIYINDITEIIENSTNKISNLLFADDLFSAVADKNIRRLFILMQAYLNRLELWFNQWRLQVST